MPRVLTPEQVEQIVEWREEGRSYKWIAARVGVTCGAINYQCLKHGALSPRARASSKADGPASYVTRTGKLCRRFTPEEDRRLLELSMAGTSYPRMAREMGRAITSIRMRLLSLAAREDLVA